MWTETFNIVVPALLSAALSGYWVGRWRASYDHAEKRIDDLCIQIAALADMASEYWMLDQSDANVALLEARLQSGLMRSARMRASLAELVVGLKTEKILVAEAEFVRATTGGNFGVHNRAASGNMAAGAQFAGGALIVELRAARLAALNRRWLPRA